MLQNLSNVKLSKFVDRKLKYTLYREHVKSYPPPGSDKLELLFSSLLSDAQCHSKPARLSHSSCLLPQISEGLPSTKLNP